MRPGRMVGTWPRIQPMTSRGRPREVENALSSPHSLGRQGACDRQRTGSVLGTFHFRALETCGGKYSTEPAIRLPEILATKTHNPKQGCKQKSLRVTKGWHKACSLFPLKMSPFSSMENGTGAQC